MAAALRFAEFVVHPDAHRLERAGIEVEVQPLVFDLLVALLQQPGVLITREALGARLWPDVHVDDGSLSQAVRRLRAVLGDPARGPRFIETVHRRGYRWIGDVRREAEAVVRPTPASRFADRYADRFVGREAELAQVRAALEAARVVTILGPGGIGKSRLAAEAIGSVGAVEVSLGACRTAEDVLGAVAGALGLDRAAAGDVRAALGGLRGLLVLDEVEGVASVLGELIAQWLVAPAPEAVVATSRIRLGLSAERVVELVGLPQDDGVTLYRERAAAVSPGASDPVETVGRLVAALGGMPLAIELAASRRRVLSAADVLERIAVALDLLVAERPDRPSHHRGLRATLDWSWSLLGDDARQAAALVSRFHGAPTLAMLEGVLGPDALTRIEALRDHSWLQQRGERFSMPRPLRLFAEEQVSALGIDDEADLRYLRAVTDHAASASRGSRAALQLDRPDLHQALTLARGDDAVALASAIVHVDGGSLPPAELHAVVDRAAARGGMSPAARAALWVVRARIDASDRDACLAASDRALELADPGSLLRGEALELRVFHLHAARETVSAGDAALGEALSIARTLAREAADRPPLLPRVLRTLARRAFQQGRFEACRGALVEALSSAAPDATIVAHLQVELATCERMLYRLDLAHALATGALERANPRWDRYLVSFALESLATTSEWEGRTEEAMALLEQAADALPPGPSAIRAWTSLRMAQNRVQQGQVAQARRSLDDWLRHSEGLSNARPVTLSITARLCGLEGDWDSADRHDAERLDLYLASEHPFGAAEALMWRAVNAGARGQVGAARTASSTVERMTSSLDGPVWADLRAVADAAVHLAAVRAGDRGSREPLEAAVARIRGQAPAGRAGRVAMPVSVRMALRQFEVAATSWS